MNQNKIIIRKGLEVLRVRSGVSDELKKILPHLPGKFSIFYENYELDQSDSLNNETEIVVLPKFGKTSVLRNNWFAEKYLDGFNYGDVFDRLLNVEELQAELTAYTNGKSDWCEMGLIKIGYMAYSDVILLGLKGNQVDQVFVCGDSCPTNSIYKFSEDIFRFFSDVEQFFSDQDVLEYSTGKISGKNLVKYFGNPFWSIIDREEI